MAEAHDKKMLRKKAEAGRSVADGTPMSAERAIGQALAKTAQELMEMPLQTRGLKETRMTLADLPEVLEDQSLLLVLEGPKQGLGLFALPPATLSALIEYQTTGRLGRAPSAPRRPTRIDAAMVLDFVDGVLAGIEELLVDHDAVCWAGGFRYASFLDDPRPMGLMFDDISYRVWTIDLGFGAGGEREGKLLWVIPATGRGARPRRHIPGQSAEEGAHAMEVAAAAAEVEWHTQMEVAVQGASVTMEAVLHRITLPLSAVMEFRPGTDLPIPMNALEQLRVEGMGRRFVSHARLGQHSGMRAVRLCEEEEGGLTMGDAPRRRESPMALNVGDSPFPDIPAGDLPDMGTMGGLGDPNSASYDLPETEGGFGDLGGFGMEEGGELPPLSMALDGFGLDDEDPLKTGSDG
ncbi:FliM/FliN family flagellar motor C-terminal domain-containing protein [Thioclava sp. A2]|uniref:FliM/FliN family flagellar motor C-terminal domain-containing protein n=1 Tax=Thioclava sp. FCG-A2 TaxID=3080562 RepID=UPI002955994B|nr:FliM/FliN family flagellar motor C-terminal domain-containing protein [Thioclava sp. A2]MDV7269351.1 FliM/FliN family flagellar motor C-terminal domain-containing protein [Thioclava sp. A2]